MTVARYLNVILGGCRRLNQRAHDDFFEGVFVDEYDVSAPPLHLFGGDEAAKTGVVSQAAVPLRHVHEGFGFVGHFQLVCKCIRRWYCNCLMCSSNTCDTPVKKISQPLKIVMKLQVSN